MKFYVTGLYHTPELNDSTLPPIEVEASDRIDALSRIGATVWTEHEWQKMQEMKKQTDTAWPEPIRL